MTQELAGVDFTSTTCQLPRKADPASPLVGEMWVNAAVLKYRDNAGSPATHIIEVQDNRNVASGYAGLTASGFVAVAQGGTNSGTALSGSSIMVSNGTAVVQGAAGTATTVLHGNASGLPTYSAVSLTADVSGTLPIANGGTGSAVALSGSSIMVSNGSAVVQGAAGTATTVLHGNASGAPTYSAVSLTADISGVLPTANGGTNLSAYTTGDTLYASATNVLSKLAANATATQKFLSMTSSVPSWVVGPAVFTGASSTVAGTTGLVPLPNAGQQDSLLFGSSVWRILTATDIPDLLQIDTTVAPSTPVEGNLWNDSTQKCLMTYQGGAKQYASSVLFIQTATKTITNTAVETTMFGSGIGTLTLPANFLVIGKTLRIRIMGSLIHGTSNMQAKVKLGGVLVIDTTSVNIGATGGTPTFDLEATITCQTVGAAGTVIGAATMDASRGSTQVVMLGDSAQSIGVVNTTIALALDATFTFGTAAVGNTLVSMVATVEVIG